MQSFVSQFYNLEFQGVAGHLLQSMCETEGDAKAQRMLAAEFEVNLYDSTPTRPVNGSFA